MWGKLFGIDPIGRLDNFYEFGGHSLLATTLVNKLKREFNLELSIRDIMDQPTVADLAVSLSSCSSLGFTTGAHAFTAGAAAASRSNSHGMCNKLPLRMEMKKPRDSRANSPGCRILLLSFLNHQLVRFRISSLYFFFTGFKHLIDSA